MVKITFMGAGSTVFAKNVLGDSMCSEALADCEIRLYDIAGDRLKESQIMLEAINRNINGGRAKIKTYLGVENRKEALRNADFIVNAIQVGGYDPCTIIDFEIPKKYGLRQTIADTLGIGGIMRTLRTIPVLEDFARDIEEVCPNAWFLNYTNPMAMLTGYMQRFTGVKTIGLCHSVQVCSQDLMKSLGMEDRLEGRKELIAGINHMGWLLEICDKNGNDLYPEIRRRAKEKNQNEKHSDMVRYEYIDKLGYYCTESSEHNAEYNPFFIKSSYPELIDKFNIPLDEYPRRCIEQIQEWNKRRDELMNNEYLTHERSNEYASYIMEAIVTNKPFKIGGNVINKGGLIENLPHEACVEIPCMVDGMGINPCRVGRLPVQLAAMNMTNINVQLLTIEAAATRKKEHIYHAAMLDPHTSAEMTLDNIVKMVDELIEAHGSWLPKFK
ncbi:alpha-glucosidase/alpha-galactosidase [Ruminiclostridium cellulolyticum]|uniref:Glycoside hydrolase family 4 n=1 Tax=Ruminiclostridium cellulolyticum (strain ATCC 35319 / DSM 5812 / JCM 6584 / H10) TaxID=394503 RepID=B8I1S9_RUMCH|nr:alpha-glucosidase/alpha-galactosidase [Ruminiclostridium cellulolyticum]ACL77714.1 glycoside hydrolase family 4 [Ruminiclostridium cellulolyticum H10]